MITEKEKVVIEKLVDAWNAYMDLMDEQSDDNMHDFRYHIHRLQDMIFARQAIDEYNKRLVR